MPKEVYRNAGQVAAFKPPLGKSSARLAVGGDGCNGLYLRVTGNSRTWVLRYMVEGKATDMSLGRFAATDQQDGLTLAAARAKVRAMREAAREAAMTPLEKRRADAAALAEAKRMAAEQAAASLPTFGGCAAETITLRTAELKNQKSRDQWKNTLETYCKPLWNCPVDTITRGQVADVLKPIWTLKPETARRLRTRIEAVFNYAKSNEYRVDNPGQYKGVLENLLVKPSKARKVKSFASLPYREIASFMASVRKREGIAARALELAILCASRSGEVRGMVWNEIEDLDGDAPLWRIPAERMKMGEEHVVPLTPRAVAILKDRRKQRVVGTNVVFPGERGGKMSDMTLSAVLKRMKVPVTVHGFRSSFKDWAANVSAMSDEISEECLAHRVGDKIRRHYRREQALDKRRELLTEWQDWCANSTSNVVPMKATA